jgi:hypothetical protein
MKIFIGIIVGLILALVGFTWLTLHWSYSDGERAGLLQKFSRRGWICKTYEGEMVLATVATVNAEKFLFTVRDPDIAKQLTGYIGDHITVHYEQRKWIPTSCFGDTEYFVTRVQRESPAQPQPQTPQALPPTPQTQPPATH